MSMCLVKSVEFYDTGPHIVCFKRKQEPHRIIQLCQGFSCPTPAPYLNLNQKRSEGTVWHQVALEEVEWDKGMPMNSEQHTRLNRGRKSTEPAS